MAHAHCALLAKEAAALGGGQATEQHGASGGSEDGLPVLPASETAAAECVRLEELLPRVYLRAQLIREIQAQCGSGGGSHPPGDGC